MTHAIPAGSWHVVMDSVILKSVDVKFELIYRTSDGDQPIATWSNHFDPKPGVDFTAEAYELDIDGAATGFTKGDQLIFRYSGSNSTAMSAYVPNGDGVKTKGRIPNFTLPSP
jgi:hypothetical protein